MRKIPTLYQRDPDDRAHVTSEVTPGCEWVIAGEGVPRHKFDGTAVMYDNHTWYARREVKAGKKEPDGFEAVSTDEDTGKTVGWEPIENSGFHKHFKEALDNWLSAHDGIYPFPGTYELCGPKISNKKGNPNPEDLDFHQLLRHDMATTALMMAEVMPSEELTVALTSKNPKTLVKVLGERYGWEGVVWWHPNGALVKLKYRDLGPADLSR